MMRALFAIATVIVILMAAACNDPPKVIQGKTVSYDEKTKILAVQDDQPPQAVLGISVATADIGADPAAGDLVRIAYRLRDGKNSAIRVMNITRQSELAGGGH